MSRRQAAWRRQWEANAPERERCVRLKIVCSRHPDQVLFEQGLSTVDEPQWAGHTWVTPGTDQWSPDYRDVAVEEWRHATGGRCGATRCRTRVVLRTDDLHAIAQIVAREVSDDGIWAVPSSVAERLANAVKDTESGSRQVVEAFMTPVLVTRLRGARR